MINGLSGLKSGIWEVIWILLFLDGLRLELQGFVWSFLVWFLSLPSHGIEASLLASDCLRKLRFSIHGVVWSRRQPLACVGAVFRLLDGPTGVILLFCVVWFLFRLFRRYLALWACGGW